MGKVESFRIDGCRCWFYSHDHLSPHFHAKAPGEWEVRVFFLEEPPRLELKFKIGRVPAVLRKQLVELARSHRTDLMMEWSRRVNLE